jgi:ceramide glucosyltransferase
VLHLKTKNLRGVSILKPLKGCDANLLVNLQTFFTLDYPKYEILFCVQDHDDPAIEIVKQLMRKYPQIDAKLILGGSNVGINPKVNNMNPGYEIAKYDLIWISDDKMYVTSDTLLDMVDCLQRKGVVMVNQMPYFCDRPGMSAFFEKAFFNCVVIIFTLIVRFVSVNTCIGMSSLFEKKVIDSVGGLKCVGDSLADDMKLVDIVQKMGYKMTYSRQFGLQNASNSSIEFQFKRLLRWQRSHEDKYFIMLIGGFIW